MLGLRQQVSMIISFCEIFSSQQFKPQMWRRLSLSSLTPFLQVLLEKPWKGTWVRTQTIDTNAAYYSHSHDFINWTSAQIWLCSSIAWTSYSRKLLQMTMLLVSRSSIPQRLMNIKLFSRRWGSLSQVLWLWFRISQLVLPTITNYYIMIPIQY